MISASKLRRGLIWTGCALAALAVLLVVAAAALDAGFLHDPLVKLIAAKIDRPVRVTGALRLHILSRNPRLEADGVIIGSPPWTPAGVSAEAGKVSVLFATPHLGQELTIEKLTIEHATLHLFRDAVGHANWQMKNPDSSDPQSLPVFRALSMMDARVLLDDALKHRQFDGIVSAYDAKGTDGQQPLRIEGKGKLNGRPVAFEVVGDPLYTASRDRRYAFNFNERSSGAHLTGNGFLRRGFDVRRYDATFEASGADLKDMYYLTGTRLIDTGSFHLTGKFMRQGHTSSLSDLLITTGQSDLRGSVSIEGIKGERNIDADLNSQSLRLADLGPRAAGRDAQVPAAETRLLPDTAPDPTALRRSRVTMKYGAKRVEVGRVTLNALTLKLSNDHGDLAVTPAAAEVMGGKLQAQLKIDARKEVPTVGLGLSISGMQLAQYPAKKAGPPALEGPVDLRADLTGSGKSLREVAAHMDGTLKATMSSGMVRDSLAELTGIDLRGLGLLLAKNKREVPVRCGVASFDAREGTLTAKSLVLDTDNVLIAGEGFVRMDTETLDLVLRGYPKNVRFFQLRAPIAIEGTLKKPSISIRAHDSKLVLVDPGKAKDADCESLLR